MKKALFVCLVALFGAMGAAAQEKTVQISLPKYCCAESDPIIEKTLAYERGVESFQVNGITKSVLVTFKENKTSVEKIEKALAAAGFETEHFPAKKRAIEKLPTCCKNTAKGLESNCSHSHGHDHGNCSGEGHNHEHNHDKCSDGNHNHGHNHDKCSGHDHSNCSGHHHEKK